MIMMFETLGLIFAAIRVPFFFEPNWHAEIRPLDAAMRIQEADDQDVGTAKKSVIYGDFLTKKVWLHCPCTQLHLS